MLGKLFDVIVALVLAACIVGFLWALLMQMAEGV